MSTSITVAIKARLNRDLLRAIAKCMQETTTCYEYCECHGWMYQVEGYFSKTLIRILQDMDGYYVATYPFPIKVPNPARPMTAEELINWLIVLVQPKKLRYTIQRTNILANGEAE